MKHVWMLILVLIPGFLAAAEPGPSQDAVSITDLFPVAHFVQLEQTEESMLVAIDEIVATDENGFYILDTRQNRICHFSQTGRFIRLVGRPGQGPGEYQQALHIASVPGGGIAVLDAGARRILTYSPEGKPERTISLSGLGARFSAARFLMTDANTVALFDIMQLDWHQPAHLLAQISGSDVRVQQTFGTAFVRLNRANAELAAAGRPMVGGAVYRACAIDGNGVIWAAIPWSCTIERFDRTGKRLSTIHLHVPDGLEPADIPDADLRSNTVFRKHLSRWKLNLLAPVGNVMLCSFSANRKPNRYMLLNERGQPITGFLKASPVVGQVRCTLDHQLIGVASQYASPDEYQARWSPHEVKLLLASGWTKEKHRSQNPFLFVAKYEPR